VLTLIKIIPQYVNVFDGSKNFARASWPMARPGESLVRWNFLANMILVFGLDEIYVVQPLLNKFSFQIDKK
jgi:hypothetical protein